jgi:hypothetical protein
MMWENRTLEWPATETKTLLRSRGQKDARSNPLPERVLPLWAEHSDECKHPLRVAKEFDHEESARSKAPHSCRSRKFPSHPSGMIYPPLTDGKRVP